MADKQKKSRGSPEQVRLSPASWLATAAGAVILVVGLFTTVAVGVYGVGWHGTAIRWATGVMPLPAAVVKSRVVWVHDVLADTEAFLAYRDAHPEVQGADLSREKIQSNVLTRHVQTAIIEQLAAEREIVVTDAEVDAEFARARQNGTAEALAELLKQFGWSEAEFKDKVIRVYLLQNRLRGTLGEEALAKALAEQNGVIYLMKK